jgi:fused signal recognition particle receptor
MTTVIVLIVLLLLVGAVLLLRKRPEELPPAPPVERLPQARADRKAKRAEPRADRAAPEPPEPAKPKREPSERPPKPAAKEEPSAEKQRAHAPEPAAPARDATVAFPPVRDLDAMRAGLAKSRESAGIFGRLKALFAGRKEINPEIAQDIEEILLGSDVGVDTTEVVLSRLREQLGKGELGDSSKVWAALRAEATRILRVGDAGSPFRLLGKPTVVLVVGVNGSGKTTTIGKLATRLKAAGHDCVLAAGDTFRAAAVQQLVVWGQRVGCEVVKGKDGADPGSVIFEAIKKAEELGADVVLADTAGRLHTKANLMNELKKIAKTAAKALPGAPHETLLVIDATVGQNALAQAKEFKEAMDLTGIVLTKLDGTAKGGVILGIADTLKMPVRFVGLGERPNDLHDFSPEDFVEALLGRDSEASAA